MFMVSVGRGVRNTFVRVGSSRVRSPGCSFSVLCLSIWRHRRTVVATSDAAKITTVDIVSIRLCFVLKLEDFKEMNQKLLVHGPIELAAKQNIGIC